MDGVERDTSGSPRWRRRMWGTLLTALCATSAASATPKGEAPATVRLLDGGGSAGHRLAGVEIRLDPGAITYWRSPGEAGVPPVFDFSASLNVKTAKVAYPAPRLFDEDGTTVYGYAGAVTFPIDVVPEDPSAPVRLALTLDYAVCAKLCLPAKAHLALTLNGTGAGDEAVREALARVPTPAGLGGAASVRIDSVGRVGADGFVVDAVTPGGAGALFAEAPDPWYFSVSPGEPAPGGHLRFVLAGPDPAPPGPAPAKPLRLTLVTPSGSIEVPVRLDAVPAKP